MAPGEGAAHALKTRSSGSLTVGTVAITKRWAMCAGSSDPALHNVKGRDAHCEDVTAATSVTPQNISGVTSASMLISGVALSFKSIATGLVLVLVQAQALADAWLVGDRPGECHHLPGATVDADFARLKKQWGSSLVVLTPPQTSAGGLRFFHVIGRADDGSTHSFLVGSQPSICKKGGSEPIGTKKIGAPGSGTNYVKKEVAPTVNPAEHFAFASTVGNGRIGLAYAACTVDPSHLAELRKQTMAVCPADKGQQCQAALVGADWSKGRVAEPMLRATAEACWTELRIGGGNDGVPMISFCRTAMATGQLTCQLLRRSHFKSWQR